MPKRRPIALGGSRARGPPGESDWGFALYCRGDFDINHLGGLGPCIGRSSGSRVASRIAERYSTLMGGTFDVHYRDHDLVEATGRNERNEVSWRSTPSAPTSPASRPTCLGELATRPALWGRNTGEAIVPRCCRRQAPRSWLERTNSEIAYAHYSAKTANPAAAWGRRSKRSCNSRTRGVWSVTLSGPWGGFGRSPYPFANATYRTGQMAFGSLSGSVADRSPSARLLRDQQLGSPLPPSGATSGLSTNRYRLVVSEKASRRGDKRHTPSSAEPTQDFPREPHRDFGGSEAQSELSIPLITASSSPGNFSSSSARRRVASLR